MAGIENVIYDDSSARVFRWHYQMLVWRLRRLIEKPKRCSKAVAKILSRICIQLDRAIHAGQAERAYLLGDLLKSAYGEALLRAGEQQKLMDLCIMAMRSRQDDIAVYLLEAYTPLIKQTKLEDQPQMFEHFVLLTYIAKKLNREYILDKIIGHIFYSIDTFSFSAANAPAACRVLKAVGIVAVKNHDYPTFCRARRMVGRLAAAHGEVIRPEFTELLLGWSHAILKRDYHELFVELRLLCFEIKEIQPSDDRLFGGFCRAALDFSMMIASNRAIQCGIPFMIMVMKLAQLQRQALFGAVHFAVRTARIALDMYGVKQGFRFLYPLLEQGRQLTDTMQRFHTCDNGLNRRYLALLRHEVITLLLVAAQLEHRPPVRVLEDIGAVWRCDYASREELNSLEDFYHQLLHQLQKRRIK